MSSSEPSKWTTALGASADVNVIPATTPAGTGLASMASIFPAITQVPIDSGGIAPERADFNGLFKMLGDQSYFLQQGGVYSYSASYPYSVGDTVRYSGALYACKVAHSAGAANPTNTTYWDQIATVSVMNSAISAAISGITLPDATTTSKGVVKIGSNINVSGGTISVPLASMTNVTPNVFGVVCAGLNVWIDNNAPGVIYVKNADATYAGVVRIGRNISVDNAGNISIPDATSSVKGVVKIGSHLSVTDGEVSVATGAVTSGNNGLVTGGQVYDAITGGGGGGGSQIFFADANSTQDAAIRAAGFWRCGRGYAFWSGHSQGSAGGRWYICYAPNGHTLTDLDIEWSNTQFVICSANGNDYSRGEGCASWKTPPYPSTATSPQTGVDVPTVGMTSASEVAFPSNPYVSN